MAEKFRKNSRYNVGDAPTINQQSLASVAGKAGSFATLYLLKNHGEKEGFFRSLYALESILYAAVNGATSAYGLLEEMLKTEESTTAVQGTAGVDGESTFGSHVEVIKGRLVSEECSREAKEVAAVVAVSFGMALKLENVHQIGYWNLILYNRLFFWLSYRYECNIGLEYDDIDYILEQHAFTVIGEMGQSPEEGMPEVPMTSFAFEDLSDIFSDDPISHVDPQLMKDSELQSYKLNLEFNYSDTPWRDDPLCEDQTIGVVNEYGKVTGLKNIGPIKYPCIDEAYNITPITGTIMKRTIVEAPPVVGTYDDKVMTYIEKRLRDNYPAGVQYSRDADTAEEFKTPEGEWLSNFKIYNETEYRHTVSDSSIYEPYVYVNDHETRDGRPWSNDYRKGSCWTSQGGYLFGGKWDAWYGDCVGDENQCINYTTPTTQTSCEEAGAVWFEPPYAELTPYCYGFTTETICDNIFGTWHPNQWIYSDKYEIPAPEAFPYGGTSDMSLRHHFVDYDQSDWWNDLSYIHKTGFAVAPLEFSTERLIEFFADYKANPIIDASNVARRAFSATAPTIRTEPNTVGPPQPLGYTPTSSDFSDYEGGPFGHVVFSSENKTLKQLGNITVTPGWMWRFRVSLDTPAYHTMETGGWSMPLTTRYHQHGYSDPINSDMEITLESKAVSNNYDKNYIAGAEIHPSINNTTSNIHDPEGRHNQSLTPNRFFGMGDASQDYTINSQLRKNAGYKYTFHSAWTGDIPEARLDAPFIDGVGAGKLRDTLVTDGGLEQLYSSQKEDKKHATVLGAWGDNYWNEYITGYMFVGDDPSDPKVGEIVSCMHPYIAYSTTSDKTLNYWHVQPDTPSYFPWSGYAGIDPLGINRALATAPYVSECVSLFPEILIPTTTTTVDPSITTTTCDPMYAHECTTTTSTYDPFMESCENPKQLTCPDYCDAGWHTPGEVLDLCSYRQCVALTSETNGCHEVGISPEDWGWVPLYGKQRAENPPRYWRGPFGSTHRKIMYPHASGAFNQWYEEQIKEKLDHEISGFPTKIRFDVEVHEYTAKDICSGGYVDWDGSIVLSSRVKNEDGKYQPQFQKETGNYFWTGLVDENFTPQSEAAQWDERNGTAIVIGDTTHTRNQIFYDQPPTFMDGHRVGLGQRILWLDEAGEAYEDATVTGMGFGGYHAYTGYKFDIVATYAKPSYSLERHGLDFQPLQDALKVGNESVYKCGLIAEGGGFIIADFDPIYFHPMVSNTSVTGFHNKGGLYGLAGYEDGGLHEAWDDTIGGQLIHPQSIYGDHWMGLRSGSLVLMTGYLDSEGVEYDCWDTTTTTADPCENESLSYEEESFCSCVETAHGGYDNDGPYFHKQANKSGPLGMWYTPNYWDVRPNGEWWWEGVEATGENQWNEGGDRQLGHRPHPTGPFLFNISPTGIDIHFRNLSFYDGYELDDCSEGETYGDCGSSANFIGGTFSHGTPLVTKGHTYSITGTGPSGSTPIAFFKNDGSLSGLELEVNAVEIIGEGLLFELPDGEWAQSGDPLEPNYGDYETIIEHGARIALGLGAGPQVGTTVDPGFGNTTTTTTTEEAIINPVYMRVSGWREQSTISIKLTNFEIYGFEEMPNDSQFIFQQSGDCTLTGYMKYDRQEEASVYTEGIILKDISEDPMMTEIDYPHYASDVLKRPGFTMPNTETSLTEVGHPVYSAPSRMLTRWNIDFIEGVTETGGYMVPLKSQPKTNYNKFVWPTISDLYHYNGNDMSWESIPPDDGHIYTNSYLMISAEAGQPIDVEETAFPVRKRYTVTEHWSIYDSMMVDPIINTKFKKKLGKGEGGSIGKQIEPAGGYIVPEGTSVWDIKHGIVSGEKQGIEPHSS